MTQSGEQNGSSQPTAHTPFAGSSDSQKPLEDRILLGLRVALLVGLTLGGIFAWWKHDSDQRQAQADAEQARIVKYCDGLYNKMDSFLTVGGIPEEGKVWAAETLRTAPPLLLSECPETYNWLKDSADGTVDRRVAGNAAWDCYDKGHADGSWRSHGGVSIRDWEDQLAASCGVQGSIPQEKSAVRR